MPVTATAIGRSEIWEDIATSKPNRDMFMAGVLAATIPNQITTIRQSLGWTKKQLAEKAGMAANRISLLEKPPTDPKAYDNCTISTLKRIASAFDVALSIQFVSFSHLVNQQIFNSQGTPVPFLHDKLGNPPSQVNWVGGYIVGNDGVLCAGFNTQPFTPPTLVAQSVITTNPPLLPHIKK